MSHQKVDDGIATLIYGRVSYPPLRANNANRVVMRVMKFYVGAVAVAVAVTIKFTAVQFTLLSIRCNDVNYRVRQNEDITIAMVSACRNERSFRGAFEWLCITLGMLHGFADSHWHRSTSAVRYMTYVQILVRDEWYLIEKSREITRNHEKWYLIVNKYSITIVAKIFNYDRIRLRVRIFFPSIEYMARTFYYYTNFRSYCNAVFYFYPGWNIRRNRLHTGAVPWAKIVRFQRYDLRIWAIRLASY